MLIRELTFAAIGTGFTCLATVLGAAMVFFFREDLKPATQKIFLGFAAGVMVAASVWSLLIPSMEMAEEMGQSLSLIHIFVVPSVDVGAGVVPGAEHGLDGAHQLLLGVGGEVCADLGLVLGLELAGQLLQVLGGERCV